MLLIIKITTTFAIMIAILIVCIIFTALIIRGIKRCPTVDEDDIKEVIEKARKAREERMSS